MKLHVRRSTKEAIENSAILKIEHLNFFLLFKGS